MSQSIAFAQAYTKALDKEIVDKAKTAFFADNAMNAKFTDAHTVNVPYVELVGLGNYTDANGYPAADTNLAFKAYTVAMDRGRELGIDRIAASQTGLGNLAGELGAEYIRTQVVPEMDAYCISKLATHAETKSQEITAPTSGTAAPIEAFNSLIAEAEGKVGYDEEFVLFVNPTIWEACMGTSEITRMLGVADFKSGNVNTMVKTYNGIPIIPMRGTLMKSAYTFAPGSSTTTGGFSPREASGSGASAVAAARDVYALIVPKKAVMFCKNLQKVKIFSPDINQGGDRWKIQVRVFYDYFIKHSYDAGIWAYMSAVPTE